MRLSRLGVESKFSRVCKLLNKDTRCVDVSASPVKFVIGGWDLDYAPAYGGYIIHEYTSEEGCIILPLGNTRRSAQEMMIVFETISAMFWSKLVIVNSMETEKES